MTRIDVEKFEEAERFKFDLIRLKEHIDTLPRQKGNHNFLGADMRKFFTTLKNGVDEQVFKLTTYQENL